jgi:hypothetical protein
MLKYNLIFHLLFYLKLSDLIVLTKPVVYLQDICNTHKVSVSFNYEAN